MQDMTMVDDDLENFEEDEPSHLTSLVSLKRAVDDYANKLVRTQDNDIPPSGKVTAGATYDATPAEIEEGKIKATRPTPRIKLSADHRISDDKTNNSGMIGPIVLTDEQKEEAEKESKGILLLKKSFSDYSHLIEKFPIEIRMKNVCYSVPYTEASSKIRTVYNSSFVYKTIKQLKQLTNGVGETKQAGVSPTKYVLDNISLCLKPGKM